jgi:putative restriction endonuclease
MELLIENYANLFSDLKKSGTHDWPNETLNKAPYKPLLLICVLERVEEGALTKNLIKLDSSLFEQFEGYWKNIIGDDVGYNLAMPFYYMRSEGFWHLIRNDGTRDNESSLSSITVTSLNANQGLRARKSIAAASRPNACTSNPW